MKAADFTGTTPALVPETCLTGILRVWGMFQDRFGVPRQYFRATIAGAWDADAGRLTLTEDFEDLGDGFTRRVWTIDKLADGHYAGTADDLVGPADVAAHGRAVNLRYRMRVPIGRRTWVLSFDDWLFRVDDHAIMNRATVTKAGVRLGSISSVFTRDGAE